MSDVKVIGNAVRKFKSNDGALPRTRVKVSAFSLASTIALMVQAEVPVMQTVKYMHWQDDGTWLGYLEDYPDYWTQGETLDDLLDHLKDLFADLSGGHISGARNSGRV